MTVSEGGSAHCDGNATNGQEAKGWSPDSQMIAGPRYTFSIWSAVASVKGKVCVKGFHLDSPSFPNMHVHLCCAYSEGELREPSPSDFTVSIFSAQTPLCSLLAFCWYLERSCIIMSILRHWCLWVCLPARLNGLTYLKETTPCLRAADIKMER